MEKNVKVDRKFFEDRSKDFLSSSPLNVLYDKEIYVTQGIKSKKHIVFQMIGNLGGHPNDYEFKSYIGVFVLGDLLLEKLLNGEVDATIKDLENRLNAKGNYYKDLIIITESTLIEFVKRRILKYNDSATQYLVDLLK
jgi:hypothetical protein